MLNIITHRLFAFLLLLLLQVTCDGIFELRLDAFVNELNRDASGQCCHSTSSTNNTAIIVNNGDEQHQQQQQTCEHKCHTFFRVCFQNYQAKIGNNLDNCVYGQKMTPVLNEKRISKHAIILPFQYSWPVSFRLRLNSNQYLILNSLSFFQGTFLLIVEAWNNASANAPAHGKCYLSLSLFVSHSHIHNWSDEHHRSDRIGGGCVSFDDTIHFSHHCHRMDRPSPSDSWSLITHTHTRLSCSDLVTLVYF